MRHVLISITVLLTALPAASAELTPSAARISAAIAANDTAQITGGPGAVTASAYVLCVSLETAHYAFTQADAAGAFAATLFAPAGTTILIKVDPDGFILPNAFASLGVMDHHANELITLNGTTIRVPDPPPTTGAISFGSGGSLRPTGDTFVSWSLRGSIPKTQFQRGEAITIDATLTARFTGEVGANARARVSLSLTPLSKLAQSTYASTFMTPTDLPIERKQWLFTGYQSMASASLTPAGTAQLIFALPIPGDLPDDLYRPVINVQLENVTGRPLAGQPFFTFIDNATRAGPATHLPLILRVGDPKPPRLSFTLLMNDIVQAQRGVVATEERGRFGIAPHLAIVSERLVLPRTNIRSGQPITYNLEPFAPAITLGDRGSPPAPPLVPLRFPSGQLRVTIRAPDGSTRTLGPAPFRQDLLSSAPTREGGGNISDPYRLSTGDSAFDIQFASDGVHTIVVEGEVEDIFGNTWRGGGTYEVDVARTLAIDPSPVIGTQYEVGDAITTATALAPPIEADVTMRVRFAPQSDASRMIDRTFTVRSNRFGFARALAIVFAEGGEYRVDITASGVDSSGTRWSGLRTWGGVVAPKNSSILAHGRRGLDSMPIGESRAWYFRTQTGQTFGTSHMQIPFHSGDVMWMEDGDAAAPGFSFQDNEGSLTPVLKRYCCSELSNERAQLGEIPLFSANLEGLDTHLAARENDITGYGYRFVERPAIRVRELIGEDTAATYWRFNDLYGNQLGTGANGDLPNDFKFQFGGAVLRGALIGAPRYAIYGSLFVLVPTPDAGGSSRVFPPFSTEGGPLFTLKGKPVELFFHPTAVRPGTILHVGETASFAGQVAPTLPANVNVTITSPRGVVRRISGRANLVGAFNQPSGDFAIDEPGVWKATVSVLFDGSTSAGPTQPPYPTGAVLGSRNGEFSFYAVRASAPPATVSPLPRFVQPASTPIVFALAPPVPLTNARMTYTVTMPGVILEEGATSALSYPYDAQKLAADFPNLDLDDHDGHTGVDPITFSFLISGEDAKGNSQAFARQIVLQGEELMMPAQKETPVPPRRRVGRR